MFKSQTVFIVGAGASAEIDMPVGAELQSQIANLWPLFDGRGRIRSGAGDVDLFRAASPASDSQSGYIRAADAIRTGLMGTRSIDEFLEWHSANEPIVRLGKAAISRCILRAERNKAGKYLGIYEPFSMSSFSNTWYEKLFKQLMAGRSRSDADIFSNVHFIVFNYDRCLEMFLWHALQTRGYSTEEATELITTEKLFLHPYGTIGSFAPSHFGQELSATDCVQASLGIRVYTENDQGNVGDVVRSAVAQAETLVFLGFSYHDSNMKMLCPAETRVRQVFGTMFGISEPNKKIIIQDLTRFLSPTVRSNFMQLRARDKAGANEGTFFLGSHGDRCATFLDDHEKPLTRI